MLEKIDFLKWVGEYYRLKQDSVRNVIEKAIPKIPLGEYYRL